MNPETERIIHDREMDSVKAAWAIMAAIENGLPDTHRLMVDTSIGCTNWLSTVVWC